jgi:hypothetical protein
MRLRVIGDPRTTASGAPNEWAPLLLAADRVCRHPTGWQAGACMKPLTRCPAL